MFNRQQQKTGALTALDREYQTLLKECQVLEKEYLRIAAALSCEDRDILDRYITVCEEMEYRSCMLALNIKTDPFG